MVSNGAWYLVDSSFVLKPIEHENNQAGANEEPHPQPFSSKWRRVPGFVKGGNDKCLLTQLLFAAHQMDRLDPIEFARHLRKCSNSYEGLMWQMLRNRQRCKMKFRRQQPLGPYTADFFCSQLRLVIEIDGSHHFTEQEQRNDAARDAWMNEQGITVLRFTGKRVDLELQAVCAEIDDKIREIMARLGSSKPRTP